jgi:hypothetical protein
MAYLTQNSGSLLREPIVTPKAIGRWLAVADILSRGFNGFFNAIYRSRQKSAEREIERFFEDRDFRMTDAQERELSNRLISGGSWTNWR